MSIRGAIERIAAEVELDHDVEVEVVVVGDCPIDERVEAFVGAVREATINAAKHSGVHLVTVFVENDGAGLSGYVRDAGCGFDISVVPDDRHGLVDSVIRRIERVGGSAVVSSAVGSGTEVEIRLPSRPEVRPELRL